MSNPYLQHKLLTVADIHLVMRDLFPHRNFTFSYWQTMRSSGVLQAGHQPYKYTRTLFTKFDLLPMYVAIQLRDRGLPIGEKAEVWKLIRKHVEAIWNRPGARIMGWREIVAISWSPEMNEALRTYLAESDPQSMIWGIDLDRSKTELDRGINRYLKRSLLKINDAA